MITLDKLNIYHKYHGDGDMWNRLETTKEGQILNYSDWKIIDELVQDLILINNVNVSNEYKNKIEFALNKNCEDETTINYLKKIASDFIY